MLYLHKSNKVAKHQKCLGDEAPSDVDMFIKAMEALDKSENKLFIYNVIYVAREINFYSFVYIWLRKGNQYVICKQPKITG